MVAKSGSNLPMGKVALSISRCTVEVSKWWYFTQPLLVVEDSDEDFEALDE